MPSKRSQIRSQGLVLTITTIAGAFLSAPARAVDIVDDPVHISEQVTQVLQTSNSLCWEMYRFHQKEPDFRESYRAAKDLWAQANDLQNTLQSGTVETQTLLNQVASLNEAFAKVEKTVSRWGDGDRSSLMMNSGPTQRTIVTPGTEVDLPLLGIYVGGPRVYTVDDGPPLQQRRRLHPNSHGSKRSLQRELTAVKLALSYLQEDSSMNSSSAPSPTPAAAPEPKPPTPDSTLEPSKKSG